MLINKIHFSHRSLIFYFIFLFLQTGCSHQSPLKPNATLVQQVTDTELAFAQTMAARDFKQFSNFIAEEAVFYSGDDALVGKEKVLEIWQRYYASPAAPFSWRPEKVDVLESGMLAMSSGPVFDADGKNTGSFFSIWRRAEDGKWYIVFDKGCEVCQCQQ
jgi:ketosteroid isomerase-like protein